MLIFGAACGQLDDRRGLLKDLAAAVEDKVVVSSDFGEGDGERGLDSSQCYLMPCPPRPSFFEIGALTERSAVSENSSAEPEPTSHARRLSDGACFSAAI